MDGVSLAVLDKARTSGMFFFVDSDLRLDKPQTTIEVDRDLVATLGLTQQDVGAALGAALGGGYVNYFSIGGRSYKVIPQVLQADRLNSSQVLDYHLRTPTGALMPASTVARETASVVPEGINHFQQLNSATIQGVFVPSVSEKQVLDFMKKTIAKTAPLATRSTTPAPRASSSRSRRLRPDAAVRDRHRVPRARRAVRELSRSGGDPDLGPDGAVRGLVFINLGSPRSTSTRRSGWSR